MPESVLLSPLKARARRRLLLTGGYGLLALGFFLAGFLLPSMFAGERAPASGLERARLPRPVPVGAFSLHEIGARAGAAPYTRERLLNQWTLMYFGYSHCPDMCRPAVTVLAELARALGAGSRPAAGTARPQLVFVTIDPARDTPAALDAFLAAAGTPIHGLRGSAQQIAGLARQLGILYAARPADGQGAYLVDHPPVILLIDPRAQLRAGFSMPREAARIAALIGAIKTDYDAEKNG